MAKRKKTAPRKRRSPAKRKTSSRRKSVRQAGFTGMLTDVALGVAGAVVASKVAPMIPIGSAKVKYAVLTVGGALLARKPGPMRAIGVGMSIASGTLLAKEFLPNLLTAGTPATVGRLSPETQRRMEMAAAELRGRGTALVNGSRDRTIVGSGGMPVNGNRNRTVVGDGGAATGFDAYGLSY